MNVVKGVVSGTGSVKGSISTLIAKDGVDGISPIVEVYPFDGGTEVVITDAEGEKRIDVLNGVDGFNAYEVALRNGFEGTEEEWLASLKGDPLTYEDLTNEQKASLIGPRGEPGKDGTVSFEELTDAQRESLRGEKGDTGNPGVYLGSGDAPEDCSVQIDPDGEAITFEGITPVKGVDYWTPADIAEIKGYVDEAILGGAW